jgi:hypothetical protein
LAEDRFRPKKYGWNSKVQQIKGDRVWMVYEGLRQRKLKLEKFSVSCLKLMKGTVLIQYLPHIRSNVTELILMGDKPAKIYSFLKYIL